jgi:copper transport protein
MHRPGMLARRWLFGLSGTLIALLLGTVGTASPAHAHAAALGTEPASGSTVEASPPRILVRFGSPVEISLGALRLVDEKGANVAIGAPEHPGGEVNALAASVSNLADGGYVAVYQVISSDGHLTRGAFTFQVGRASAPVPAGLVTKLSTTSERGALPVITALARLLLYAGVMVAVGGLFFLRRCWPHGTQISQARRVVQIASIVAVVASTALIGLAAAQASGRGITGFTDTTGWRAVLSSEAGKWWVLRTVGTVLLAIVALAAADIGKRLWGLALAATAAVVFVGMAKGGHGTSGRWAAAGVAMTLVHLAAASAWVGGLSLGLLALAGGRGIDSLKRFSNVALLSVIGVVGSGVVQSARQLREWDGWDSGYGHTLRSKLIVVVVLIVIGGTSRQLTRRHTDGNGPIKVRDLVGLEVVFATGVLALTMSLIAAPPPAPAAPKPFTTTMVVGSRAADIIVEPAAQGVNTVHVTVQNNDGSIKNPSAITIRFSNDAAGIPAIAAQPTQRLANHASFENVVIPVTGEWKLEVLATYGGETVRFSTPVKIR